MSSYANQLPTILTEGKTDNVYLKSAIQLLASSFPQLASENTATSPYKLLLRFVELYGGADYLRDFIIGYRKQFKHYSAPRPEHPVIIVVDNDSGPKNLINYVNKIEGMNVFPASAKDIRSSEFVHIFHNLYVVLTPKGKGNSETDIEYFFTDVDRLRKHKDKYFNIVSKRDLSSDLSKEAFARYVVHANKKHIDFNRFQGILGRMVKVFCSNQKWIGRDGSTGFTKPGSDIVWRKIIGNQEPFSAA